MKRHVPLLVMAAILLLLGAALHAWNSHVPEVPPALASIVPGKSTMREFLAAMGTPCERSRTCLSAGAYQIRGWDSSAYGRVLFIEAEHSRSIRAKKVPALTPGSEDDDEVVLRIHVGTFAKFDRYTGNACARVLAMVSDWDYDLTHR